MTGPSPTRHSKRRATVRPNEGSLGVFAIPEYTQVADGASKQIAKSESEHGRHLTHQRLRLRWGAGNHVESTINEQHCEPVDKSPGCTRRLAPSGICPGCIIRIHGPGQQLAQGSLLALTPKPKQPSRPSWRDGQLLPEPVLVGQALPRPQTVPQTVPLGLSEIKKAHQPLS